MDISAIEEMKYSGRGITIGMTPSGNIFAAYTLTGRSPPSQARELLSNQAGITYIVRTNVTNKEELEKGSPALLIYPAMVGLNHTIVASNGAQTKLLLQEYMKPFSITSDHGVALERILGNTNTFGPLPFFFEYDAKGERWIDITRYEPDGESTARVSGVISVPGILPRNALHISGFDGDDQFRKVYVLESRKGLGHFIATYDGGNEKPRLKPFQGLPREVGIDKEDPIDMVNYFFDAINHGEKPGDNFAVSASVMLYDNATGKYNVAIRNRFSPVKNQEDK